MIKKKFYLLTLFLGLISCGNDIDIDEKINHPTTPQKDFEKEFVKKYGTVSPEISWMTVSSSLLRIVLPDLYNNVAAKVQVFTADPCAVLEYCYLLSEYEGVKDGAEIKLDYPTGLNYIYVTVFSADGESTTTRIDVRKAGTLIVDYTDVAPDVSFVGGKPMKYLMCFEGFTSGKSLDFDYNDIVAEIEYVRGRKSMIVRAVAAGCTCRTQLLYRRSGNQEKGTDEILFEEIHKEMGLDGRFDYMENRIMYLMLNTGINSSKYIPEIEVMLNDDVDASITAIAPKIYAKFTITAKKEKDEKMTTAFLPVAKGVNYPQAILIAYPDFAWSREALVMSAAYSEFRLWISEPELYPFWYGGVNWEKANEYVGN